MKTVTLPQDAAASIDCLLESAQEFIGARLVEFFIDHRNNNAKVVVNGITVLLLTEVTTMEQLIVEKYLPQYYEDASRLDR